MIENLKNQRLGFIGAGNMARSIIGGLIGAGVDRQSIYLSDPATATAVYAKDNGLTLVQGNDELIADVDIVVLAIKPQIMKAVLETSAEAFSQHGPLIISVAAGITCELMQSWSSTSGPIIRCMPNTPALLNAGATGLYASETVTTEQRDLATAIVSAVGIVSWVNQEADLDAVTAISGSGPAYFFLFMEYMVEHAKRLGLSDQDALALVQQTALGAAKMVEADEAKNIALLRKHVTSPNGTTEAAINTFIEQNLGEVVGKAVDAAHQRSEELASELA